MANGFIKPSRSRTDTSVLFIPQHNWGLQICVDNRGLNNLTIKNPYSLCLIGDSLNRLGQVKQFTKLDIIDAYYRIGMKEEEEWKTVFQFSYGHYKNYIMYFDLANAPAIFQSHINMCFAERLDIFVNVYLDDILICTNEKGSKHKDAVRWILYQLRKYGLYIKLKKSRLSTDTILFLYYIVSILGVEM